VLPIGEVGELMARGPGVTRGYYDRPEATAEAFDAEGWLHTGDLGRLDDHGYLTLVGRVKETYRCGGEQVTPSEIEDVLMGHPAVLQAHVAPVPDDRMGEVGVAFIVPQPGHDLQPEALIAWSAERLARFKVPRHVLPIEPEAVPLTASGRPRKFLLTARAVELLGLR
jgi:fatty-acyl-CoA synthase